MNQNRIAELESIVDNGYPNIAGIFVQKDGAVTYENYFHGYAAGDALHVYSVTKSVFSILIGIAVDKGYIRSIHQPVLDFFPDYKVPEGEKTIQDVTIKNLLTMTAPYKYETEPYVRFFASENPIRDALDLLGGEKAIGTFHYSAIGGTHILAGILTRAVGQPVLAFATEHLFAPLGIQVNRNVELHSEEEHLSIMADKNTKGWVVDPQGINTASWGLFLRPLEMARIGQLYLNGGKWEEKQIVSAAWIAESTREQSFCREFGNLAYGYLWWLIDEDIFAAIGDGGNVIYVNRKKRMVITIGAVFLPEVKDSVRLIREFIEPILE